MSREFLGFADLLILQTFPSHALDRPEVGSLPTLVNLTLQGRDPTSGRSCA